LKTKQIYPSFAQTMIFSEIILHIIAVQWLNSRMPIIEISFTTDSYRDSAKLLSEKLGLPLQTDQSFDYDYLLSYSESGLSLVPSADKGYGSIQCDFAGGAHSHRRRFGGGNGQSIAKAIGVSGKFSPQVLDLTAGLGGDAFVLASLGCSVTMIERNPIVYCLLADGLERAVVSSEDDSDLAAIVERITLIEKNSAEYLQQEAVEASVSVDVVYLDPMFPGRKKSAKVKKQMQAFHSIVGSDADADQLLALATKIANYRVVVKRPSGAEYLAASKPSYSLEGKSTRYDIYTLKKLPS
jgi:16S rRNA (guanine1516-N2)-methyltransferase